MRRPTPAAVEAAALKLWEIERDDGDIDGRRDGNPMPPFERRKNWWIVRAEWVLQAAIDAEDVTTDGTSGERWWNPIPSIFND